MEESECIRAKEREFGSYKAEVIWGGDEGREGLGRLSFEAREITTIRNRKSETEAAVEFCFCFCCCKNLNNHSVRILGLVEDQQLQ